MHQMDKEDEVDNEQSEAVRQLSRVPCKCPVTKCSVVVLPSNLMMHMMTVHAQDAGITKSDMYEHRPLLMCFDTSGCEYGVNRCVAMLMYGGVSGKPMTQPGHNYLSLSNHGLINDAHRYDNYLPIMMMVCRSTWYAQIKDKELERRLVAINANRAGIYVFWLVAPSTTRKVYYTLTGYDRCFQKSRSVIRAIRDFSSSQNPSEFMPTDDNYLLLRDSEVNEFLSLGVSRATLDGKPLTPGVPMELIIYETPMTPKALQCECDNLKKNQPVKLAKGQNNHSKQKLPRTKIPIKRNIPGTKPTASKTPSKATTTSSASEAAKDSK